MCVCGGRGGGKGIYFIETRNPNSINDGNKDKFGQFEIESEDYDFEEQLERVIYYNL